MLKLLFVQITIILDCYDLKQLKCSFCFIYIFLFFKDLEWKTQCSATKLDITLKMILI